MNKRQMLIHFFGWALLVLSFGATMSMPLGHAADPDKFRPIPKASCGPQDRSESVQGQTTFAERFSPGAAKAYNCNLELAGQFEGDGAGFSMQIYKNCAYYSTWPNPQLKRPGVVVLDISDSRQPRATAYLDGPIMRDVNESLTVSHVTQLMFANQYSNAADAPLEVYDISADCSQPVIKSRSLPGLFLHAGEFSGDGRLFFGAIAATEVPSSKNSIVSGLFAVEVNDSSKPKLLGTWVPQNDKWVPHAVTVNEAGTRAYVSLLRFQDDSDKSPLVNGLVILDVSDIRARRQNPQFRVISTHFWDETHYAQFPLLTTIGNRSYVVFADMAGAIGTTRPAPQRVCASGRPGHGFARLIDISDEHNPKTVSHLMLEVQDPANCSRVMHDPTSWFGYGSMRCDVDNPKNARLLACAYLEGGLRVFDIRDPENPTEVAYYKPRARRTESRPASLLRRQASSAVDLTADAVTVPKFLNRGKEIAFISLDNGFQVVRFTERFTLSRPDLFRH